MKKLYIILLILLPMLVGCHPAEVRNAVKGANEECPVNLAWVASLESVDFEGNDVAFNIKGGKIMHMLGNFSPEQTKMGLISLLRTAAGKSFDEIGRLSKKYEYNVIINIEDENGEYAPLKIVTTPDEIGKTETYGLNFNLF